MKKNRLLCIICVALATMATLTPWSSALADGPSMQGESKGRHLPLVPGDERITKIRTIACWGDSLTEVPGADEAIVVRNGREFDASYLSYPEILERLTCMTTFNYGVSGANSDEIAFMQGGLTSINDIGEFGAIDMRVIRQSRLNPGDILIMEMGSNGGWNEDYDELIAQYWSMIKYAGCEDFLIIGDTDDPGSSLADVNQEPFEDGTGTGETSWEAALQEEFGDRFINMRVFLVEQGLETAGLEATEEDEDDAGRGCISQQLRSDWTHLNSYGCYAKAVAIYDRGVELGYWN